MATKKMKRYDRGGDVMETVDPEESKFKQRGLEASKKEAPVGFFERLRMGNIDDPNSEAYKRFGAGRGRAEMVPVEDRTGTPVSQTPVSSKVETTKEPVAPTASTSKTRAVSTKDDEASAQTKPSPISTPVAGVTPSAKPSASSSTTSTTAEGMRGYKPRRENVEQPLTQEQLMAQIPTGGSGRNTTTGGSNSSEFERNAYNTMIAMPGLAGISRAGAAGSRAAQGAGSASRALSTGAETPVTYLGRTAGKAMNAPRLAGKGTDVVAKEVVSGAKAAEKATSKVSGPQKTLAGPKDKSDNVREAARKLSEQDKNAKDRATRDRIMDRSAWLKGASAMKRGGGAVGYAKGGSVTRRGDGIAQRGRTKGVMR